MAKRARERARQEKQDAKRERRRVAAEEAENAEQPDEAKLMEEFRVLSERHAAGTVGQAGYELERKRIFVELGIETEED